MSSVKTKKAFIILLSLTGFFSMQAQQSILKGKVTDSLHQPLVYANILAIPENDNLTISFAITDNDGSYNIKLQSGETYEVNVSYLGFEKITKTFTLTENTTENYILKATDEQLDAVTISYKHQPVIVKKDTIIYNVGSFVTGSERKLRDVLKNLPGVEVDRKGNVTVNGKSITKVLVEGETFFTGDGKLAVNNIPADAAETIEILDDYHEVAMFKGLETSDQMAMNIKLKEDKKKFVFGDIEIGGGIENRYVINPKLFYYSPKTNVSFIGDVGNVQEKAFTMRDYIEFEGGRSMLLKDANAHFRLYNSDMAQYISNRDFMSNISQFGALNIRQSVSQNTDVSGYVIATNSKTETASRILNQYTTTDTPFIEERNAADIQKNFFTLGKATLRYSPGVEKDFSFSSFFKISENQADGQILSVSPMRNSNIATRNATDALHLKQHASFSRKLSKNHTITTEAVYDYSEDKPINRWITNQPLLQGLIPLEEENTYHILQDKKMASHNFTAVFKDYWVLHRFHHLYTSLGVNMAFSNFFSKDYQQLSDGSTNNFSQSGFGNDLAYDLTNVHFGLEYKFQIGIAVFKPGATFHFFHWQTEQIDQRTVNNTTVVLPKLSTDLTFSSSEKLTFRYRKNVRLPNVEQMADRYILSHFNSVFRGNSGLGNERYHSASLSYYKFRLFKGYRFNIMSSYHKKEKHFKNATELDGIEQLNEAILFDRPEHNWNISGSLSKDIAKIRANIKTNYSYSDFYQLLNNKENLNISNRFAGTLGIKTLFEKFPTIELGYTKEYRNYRATSATTEFENNRFFAMMDYVFLNDFIIKMDYFYDAYTNKNKHITSYFDNANASLFYQGENSPWGFEIAATNIFNLTYKQQNNFSDFLISDTRTYIFPRVLLLKVSYKL